MIEDLTFNEIFEITELAGQPATNLPVAYKAEILTSALQMLSVGTLAITADLAKPMTSEEEQELPITVTIIRRAIEDVVKSQNISQSNTIAIRDAAIAELQKQIKLAGDYKRLILAHYFILIKREKPEMKFKTLLGMKEADIQELLPKTPEQQEEADERPKDGVPSGATT